MKKEIAKNVSSGAKKVERVEKEVADKKKAPVSRKCAKKPTSQKAENKGATASSPEKELSKKDRKKQEKRKKAVLKERAAAEKRLALAKEKAAKKEERLLKRAKLKEKKLEKKAAYKAEKLEKKTALKEKKAERIRAREERRAKLKAKKFEKKAERAERREMLKNESEAEKEKRIARLKKEKIALRRKKHEARDRARERRAAAREAARARRAENKKHGREQRTERKKHAAGFGGWLAATVSLGVATLVLATVVTAGAVRMNEVDGEAASGYRATLYEMVSVSEDMDENLTKLKISSGREEQRKLLTNLLVDSQIMGNAIERIPVDAATSTDISSFVNRTGNYARTLLSRLATGKSLNETELNTVNYLYEVNSTLYDELNDIIFQMDDGDLREFMNGKESEIRNRFSDAGQGTHKTPETIVEAPFSGTGNVGKNQLTKEVEITIERAEQRVKELFKGYRVIDTRMTGEGAAHGAGLYNFTLTDENDNEIFAQITKNGGNLIFFDTYEECTQKNFDLETCDKIAREYLASIGIQNVEASFLSDTGMVANITYVTVKNGVRVYPESIRVRVCEEKGRVVGIDASAYLFNRTERTFETPAISKKEALNAINRDLTPHEVNLALVAINGEEVLAYEIACYTEADRYIVYLDATTGDEIEVFLIRESEGEKFIK